MSPTVPAYISSFLPTWTQSSGRTSISPNGTAEGENQKLPPPHPALGWDKTLSEVGQGVRGTGQCLVSLLASAAINRADRDSAHSRTTGAGWLQVLAKALRRQLAPQPHSATPHAWPPGALTQVLGQPGYQRGRDVKRELRSTQSCAVPGVLHRGVTAQNQGKPFLQPAPIEKTGSVGLVAQTSQGRGCKQNFSDGKKRTAPPFQLLTHHVKRALVVGHNDCRALHLEVLQSLHLKSQAEEILEGLDHSFDDSAEEKSSQQQGREVTGSATPRMGGRRQEVHSDREPPLSFALWSTQVSVLHGPICSKCFSCMLSTVCSQCGNLTGSQLDSMVHISFKLTASAHKQAHSGLFGRPKSSLVELQRANWKPFKVQEEEMLVTALDQGPLPLPVLLIRCCLFPTVPWL